jgi:hypothetical protein
MSVDRHPRREHGCGDDHEPQGNADSRRRSAPEQVAAIRPVESLTIHHAHRTGPDARGLASPACGGWPGSWLQDPSRLACDPGAAAPCQANDGRPQGNARAHPAAPDRAVALRVEPLACVHRLAPAGDHPMRNTARPPEPAVPRQRPVPVSGDRALLLPSRCA